ncbi:MAG: nuclease-related domain-containing protein [Actinomycetota bacterium]|nr:nuclease-related domain-containing protein [Actinomycetota bacterium]
MIEGGVPGGSAQQNAAQRRATADRLIIEAKWLESLAADERAMAALLAHLPPAYAIMHDIKLAGSKGNVDHLVVGPGGAFIIVTRRFADAIVLRDGEMYAGEQSLRPVLDSARVESQLLTQSLLTPVVPVLGLMGSVLPAATPHAVDGVLVCSAVNIVRVITRGSHTLLPPHKVGEVAERALPLLHNPGSVMRGESTSGAVAEPEPDTSVNPVVPPAPPASPASAQRRRNTEQVVKRRMRRMRRRQAADVLAEADGRNDPARIRPGRDPNGREGKAVAARPRAVGATGPGEPATEKAATSGTVRSVRFVVVALVVLCLVAIAVGTLISGLWQPDDAPVQRRPRTSTTLAGAGATDAAGGASTAPSSTVAPVAGQPLAAGLPAPAAVFTVSCPAAGGGWRLEPVWPGDLAGLQQYDLELQNLDGTWAPVQPITLPTAGWAGLDGLPANVSLHLRVTALMTDGSRSISGETTVSLPPAAC